MGLKSLLIELIKQGSEGEQAWFSRLSEDERMAAGTSDHWAPKDTLAHTAYWSGQLADGLAAVARGETPTRDADYNAVNDAQFKEHQNRPWPEVLDMAKQAGRRLVEQIEALDEAELHNTHRLSWQNDRPLWRVIAGTGYIHPLTMHIGPFYVEKGEIAYANQLLEEATRQLRKMDDSSDWHGLIVYNMACHYATSKQADKAIESLRQALALNPGLIEWSQQDSDLASIRSEPAYQALYAKAD